MFSQGAIEALAFYVYRLDDPRTGKPFYVGKGVGNRAYHHIDEARAGALGEKCERIRELLAAGLMPEIVIHRHGLDEQTAMHIEAALIEAYRLTDLTNLVSGHGIERGVAPAREIEGRYGLPANIIFPCMLIKIEGQWEPGLTDAQLYARTRGYWRARPTKRPIVPTHVAAVALGLIREVYKVERWDLEPTFNLDPGRRDGFDGDDRDVSGRIAFEGVPDAVHAHLKGLSVRRYIQAGSQNPIAYVNCGD